MAGLRQHVDADGASVGDRGQADHRVADLCTPREGIYEADRRRLALARTIEGEIIPRLMLAHRLAQADGMVIDEINGEAAEAVVSIADFARLAMHRDTSLAAAHVESLRRIGVSLDAIFLELFAPTARHLGKLWEEDLCDFTEVTVGLGTLQSLLRQFSPAFRTDSEPSSGQFRVLLAPAPGEQHTFGLFMVEEFFRSEGWHVTSDPALSESEMARMVRSVSYDIVGFSLSCADLLDRLGSAIRSVRKSSRNRSVVILVGGTVFVERPELAVTVGADGTAADGSDAVQKVAQQATSQMRHC